MTRDNRARRIAGHLVFSLIVAIASPVFGAPVIDQQQPDTSGGYNNAGYYDGWLAAYAQTFTVGLDGQLAGIDLWIEFFGTDPDVTVSVIRIGANGVPEEIQLLGSATLSGPSLPELGARNWFFDLSASNIFVRQGEQLAIYISSTDTPQVDGNVGILTFGGTSNPYVAGDLWATWNLDPGELCASICGNLGRDLYFRTWVDPTAPAIGQITELVGTVTVTGIAGTPIPAVRGMRLFPGDEIEASADGGASILFVDGTSFALSESSRLAIDEYTYSAAERRGSALFRLLQGFCVYVSGFIGHNDPDGVRIETPAVGIGPRGTEFILGYDPVSGVQVVHLISGRVASTPTSTGLTTEFDAPITFEVSGSDTTTQPLTAEDYDAMKLALFGAVLTTDTTAQTGIPAVKLTVIDKPSSGAKVVFTAKDTAVGKGAGTNTATVSATFRFRYDNGIDLPTEGEFVAPQGSTNWLANSSTVAKYRNAMAPEGGGIKLTQLKPGKLLSLAGRNLGDTPIAILGQNSASTGTATTQYCIDNGDEGNCFCSTFTTCSWKLIAGGTGAKLVCRGAAADAGCSTWVP